ncbi:hypothetical protein DYB31_012080 [Aphanomyces astaci]|uniref:Uncharacterized protein n=1 Tax=Aphanomyces astaci TaxID=112090 RepID=A0A397FYE2_APHAT|nr:hypothetical protein DYB31_012080 [Aphanomyces astaci]
MKVLDGMPLAVGLDAFAHNRLRMSSRTPSLVLIHDPVPTASLIPFAFYMYMRENLRGNDIGHTPQQPERRRQEQWQSRQKGRNDRAQEGLLEVQRHESPCGVVPETQTFLVAQVKRWKDGIKVLVNQPQRQKTERGVLLENVVRVDDVLLDSDSDVTVVTRRVMDALDAAGINVGTVSHSVPHLTYPYGSDAKPVVMTRSVKFNCVTLDTTCGLLVLRGLKAWVDDASTAAELIVSRPVMALLGLSVEDLLVGVRKTEEEWDGASNFFHFS